ncbi:MAG: hypothetical protein NTV89_10385 [Proteobacteria bacterium]|nr:hypothetical protein [Pseudomonadota bacterium]
MSGKTELAKLKKQRKTDELENLFDQFDEQLHAFEEKITTIKRSMEQFEAKKIMDENNIEEEKVEALHEDVISPG